MAKTPVTVLKGAEIWKAELSGALRCALKYSRPEASKLINCSLLLAATRPVASVMIRLRSWGSWRSASLSKRLLSAVLSPGFSLKSAMMLPSIRFTLSSAPTMLASRCRACTSSSRNSCSTAVWYWLHAFASDAASSVSTTSATSHKCDAPCGACPRRCFVLDAPRGFMFRQVQKRTSR